MHCSCNPLRHTRALRAYVHAESHAALTSSHNVSSEHLPDTPSPTDAYFKDKATPAPASFATRTNAEAERDVDARPDSDDTSTTQSHPSKFPHILAAYFALQDAILVLPVSREAVDEAMRVFYTYCIAAPGLSLKDVEPFAMAALVVAVRSNPSGHAEPGQCRNPET